MATTTTITITATNECPHCGTEKERITGLDAHQLNTWLKDTYGEAIATVATGYEQTNGGTLSGSMAATTTSQILTYWVEMVMGSAT